MTRETTIETFKFLQALLDDYNSCKTELARSGILKAYRMLLDKVAEDCLGQLERVGSLEKELEEAKAKLLKLKKEPKSSSTAK